MILTCSSHIYATNGYWSHGYGTKSKSIAGACVAMTFDTMCALTNPASMVELKNRKDYGLAFLIPKRGFTANDDASSTFPPASIPPDTYDSSHNLFLIPHFGYNYMLDDISSIGVTVAGNGGMNTEYDSAIFSNFSNPNDPSTQASSKTGMDLKQMFIGLTYSRKINEQHLFGITPLFAVQTIKVQGLQPFTSYSAHPDKVTDNGHDMSYGGGVRVGWKVKVTEQFTLGAAYQSKMWMSKFDDYKGLFAEEGDFDIPSTYDIGFSFKATPKVTFAVDYQRINYGDIKALSNDSAIVFTPGEILLGTEDGLGSGWTDMKIWKFGLQWEYTPDLTFRMGYSRTNDIVPNTQALLNLLTPAVITEHYTCGFSTFLSENIELSMAFMYAPNNKVQGTNPNTGSQTGYIEMEQYEVEFSLGSSF